MRMALHKEARVFQVPLGDGTVALRDLGRIELRENEMVSFMTPSGKACDFTAKGWGFYPAPSLNRRMVREGFRAALVRGPEEKLFIHLVDADRLDEHASYLAAHHPPSEVVCWLDALKPETLAEIGRCVQKEGGNR